MRKNMRYAQFAEICEKCGTKWNMEQLHIRIKMTRLRLHVQYISEAFIWQTCGWSWLCEAEINGLLSPRFISTGGCCCISCWPITSSGCTSPVSNTHTQLPSAGFRSWSQWLAVSMQVTRVINPVVCCHYFPPGRSVMDFICFGPTRCVGGLRYIFGHGLLPF